MLRLEVGLSVLLNVAALLAGQWLPAAAVIAIALVAVLVSAWALVVEIKRWRSARQ